MQITTAYRELPFKNVNFEFYKKLHYYVFSDIYEWAGAVRKINMSKKGTSFCPFEKIEAEADAVFDRLNRKNFFKGLGFDQYVDEFVDLYCLLNY